MVITLPTNPLFSFSNVYTNSLEVKFTVRIEISDEVWNLYKKSWVLLGVRGHEDLVWFLENDVFERFTELIDFAEEELLDDTTEVYVQREIGLEKGRQEKS